MLSQVLVTIRVLLCNGGAENNTRSRSNAVSGKANTALMEATIARLKAEADTSRSKRTAYQAELVKAQGDLQKANDDEVSVAEIPAVKSARQTIAKAQGEQEQALQRVNRAIQALDASPLNHQEYSTLTLSERDALHKLNNEVFTAKGAEYFASKHLEIESTQEARAIQHAKNNLKRLAASQVSALNSEISSEDRTITVSTNNANALESLKGDVNNVIEYNRLVTVTAKVEPLLKLSVRLNLSKLTKKVLSQALMDYYSVTEENLPKEAKDLLSHYTVKKGPEASDFIHGLLKKEGYFSLKDAWEAKVNSEVTRLQINPNGIVPDTDTTPTTNTNNPEQGTDTTSAPEPIISEPIISEPIISEPIIPPPD